MVATDSQGRKVDFKNTVIIMTSNVGARLITDSKANLGFQGHKEDDKEKTAEKRQSRCSWWYWQN